MKKILVIIGILASYTAIGQIIDFDHFDVATMNKVLFYRMNELAQSKYYYSITQTTVGQRSIHKFLQKKNEKLTLDDLNLKLNQLIRMRFDSRIMKETNLIGSVGLIGSFSCKDVKLYREIADRCIEEWSNSENLIFMGWSQVGNASSYYNAKTHTVYLSFVYFE